MAEAAASSKVRHRNFGQTLAEMAVDALPSISPADITSLVVSMSNLGVYSVAFKDAATDQVCTCVSDSFLLDAPLNSARWKFQFVTKDMPVFSFLDVAIRFLRISLSLSHTHTHLVYFCTSQQERYMHFFFLFKGLEQHNMNTHCVWGSYHSQSILFGCLFF